MYSDPPACECVRVWPRYIIAERLSARLMIVHSALAMGIYIYIYIYI